MKIEEQMEDLISEKERKNAEQPISFDVVKKYAKYFLQHIDQLLLQQIDPVKKADFFGVLFDQTPTYDEIASVTSDGPNNFWDLTGINELFKIKKDRPIIDQSLLVQEVGKSFHSIRDEYYRWRSLLSVEYREYSVVR